MKMVIRDELGYVLLEIDGVITFLEGIAYYEVNGEDKQTPVTQIMSIGEG